MFALHKCVVYNNRQLGPSCVGLLLQDKDTLRLSDTALSDRDQLNQTDHRPHTTDTLIRAGHEPVCLVLGWNPSTACALLEFAEAPTRILRFLYPVDIGITTTVSPALDVAALCLDSWPAAIFTQILTPGLLPATTCQLTADSLL